MVCRVLLVRCLLSGIAGPCLSLEVPLTSFAHANQCIKTMQILPHSKKEHGDPAMSRRSSAKKSLHGPAREAQFWTRCSNMFAVNEASSRFVKQDLRPHFKLTLGLRNIAARFSSLYLNLTVLVIQITS